MQDIGFSWVWPGHYRDIMVHEPIDFGKNKMARVVWNNIVLAIMWVIWLKEILDFLQAKKMFVGNYMKGQVFRFFVVLNSRSL